MIKLRDIAKLSLPNHIRKKLECCKDKCQHCFTKDDSCVTDLCKKDRCLVERFLRKRCKYKNCPCGTWLNQAVVALCTYIIGPWKYSFNSFIVDWVTYDMNTEIWSNADTSSQAAFESWITTTFPWTTVTIIPEWGGIWTLTIVSPNTRTSGNMNWNDEIFAVSNCQ